MVVPTPITTHPRRMQATDLEEFHSILILGETGVGKTRLVGEIAADPRIKRVAFVTFERGTKSIRYGRDKMDVFTVPTVDPETGELETLFKSLEKARIIIRNNVRKGVYDVVVLDPLSFMSRIGLDDVRAPMVAQAIKTGDLPPKPDWDDYAPNTATISAFIRQFKALPCHFLATCHMKVNEDKATKITSVVPDMTSALAREVPAHFDCVLYLLSENDRRMLICQNKGIYYAKNRGDFLPATLTGKDVTMSHIFDLLEAPTNSGQEKTE